MRGVELFKPNDHAYADRCKILVPRPKEGQVLIKVEVAAIGHPDILLLEGTWPFTDSVYPKIPGIEGYGTVVSSGGGILGWWLVGKKVAFTSVEGSWAQYAVADVDKCVPQPDEIDPKLAANQGNALTALALFELCKGKGYQFVVQTAACSSLGKMINRYFNLNGIKVINIVRRPEQVKILKESASKDPINPLIFDSSSSNFETELENELSTGDYRCLIDAVGGNLTSKIFSKMKPKSSCYIISALEGAKIKDIAIRDLIFHQKEICAFNIFEFFQNADYITKFKIGYALKNNITGSLRTDVIKSFPLEQYKEALKFAAEHASEGKVVLEPTHEVPKKEEPTPVASTTAASTTVASTETQATVSPSAPAKTGAQ